MEQKPSIEELSSEQIEELYRLVSEYHSKYLAEKGVQMPSLKTQDGRFTVDALVLVYLAREYPETRWVSKSELTQFVRVSRPNTNDVQSARHLGMQKGFYIVSSRRGNYLPEDRPPPNSSSYLLVSLEEPHPAFVKGKRSSDDVNFEGVKKKYRYRCATCGSKEGEPNLRYPKVRTELQQAHCNPKKPLAADNIIPQCQFCNRADRNYWVYDRRGRVIGVADLKPIKKSIQEGYLDAQQVELLYRYLKRRIRQEAHSRE